MSLSYDLTRRNIVMSKLKFITMLACVSLTCDPSSVSADHHEQHHEEISPAQMLAEFESEAERRRGEEGDHFDEGAYKFERSMMERRMALEERRIALDKDFRALDEEGQEYWSNRTREDKDRQRAEIDNRRADFEAEADRRRGEEGEYFDEEAYKFERSMMERRIGLDEKRLAIDEDFNRKREELGNGAGGEDQNAWEQLDQEQQNTFAALDEEYQALDQEGQEYWDTRQSEDMDRQRAEIDNMRTGLAQMQADFEDETDRRRSEEGEDFDEEAYEFERSMMERRIQLEGQRIDNSENYNRKLQELSSNPNTNDQDWKELEGAQEDAFEALDLKFQALDQESQEYWDTRHEDHDDEKDAQ
jgi:hypothetical protein